MPGRRQRIPLCARRLQRSLKSVIHSLKDYSDKNVRAAELAAIPGHPLYTFTKENEAFTALLAQFVLTETRTSWQRFVNCLSTMPRRGDLLYPHIR